MADSSLYEKDNPTRRQQSFGFSFGRITAVYPDERLCEVKTFMGSGAMQDNHIPKCQWINMDAHPDGDESTNIPRINSYGLVFFIQGEPFIFGFFSPLTGTGSAENGTDKEPLNEGDRVLKTVGKNKIIMRGHGEIQIESTPTCRTLYFPDQNIINTLCRNYEFRTDGGAIDWTNFNRNNDTLSKQEFRDNIARNNVIIEEKGSIDSGSFISRTTIGVGTDNGIDQPVWTRTIQSDGSTDLAVHAPGSVGFAASLKPSGACSIAIADKATLAWKETGEFTLDIGPGKVTLDFTPDGKMTVTCQDVISITAKAGVTVTAAKADVKTDGDVTITAGGKGTFKANQIEVDGGGALQNALTFPNTISDFTGAPLQPFSKTVKIST